MNLCRCKRAFCGISTCDAIHDAITVNAVIYITEGLAASISRAISHYKDSLLPSIVLIPGISGNTGQGIDGVKKSVEQAVGSDILFGGN